MTTAILNSAPHGEAHRVVKTSTRRYLDPSVAARLHQHVRAHSITWAAAAELVGVSIGHLWMISHGQRCPSPDVASRIAYSVDLDDETAALLLEEAYQTAPGQRELLPNRLLAEIAKSVLYDPLGMTNATFDQPAADDFSIGYSCAENDFVPYPIDTPDLVPRAGLTATGNDIALFVSALLDADSPLSGQTRRGLLTPAGPYPGLRAYMTGLAEWRYENRSALHHGGNGMGTTNRMTILPDEGVGFYTAVNGEALVGMRGPLPAICLHARSTRNADRGVLSESIRTRRGARG